MEPEARYTAIGAVLLVLILALAAAAVWLMRSGTRADVRHYTVYFERQSLEGLRIGSGVDMRGLQVGRVERFTFAPGNINRVEVTLRVAGRTPVSDNTVAVVERKLLTGLARISLETPGTPGPPLSAVPPGESYPVIAEGHSDFEQFSDSLAQLAVTGTSALTSVNELLNQQNREELMAAVASLRTMSQAMAGAAEDLAKSGRQLAAAAEKTGAAAQPAADQASATLRDVSRAAQALEQEFRATAQELRTSAGMVARSAERLDDPRALIFGPTPQQLGPGEKLR